MKYLFIFLSVLITNNGCEDNLQTENISFEYSAISRGVYNKITIDHNIVSVQDKRNEQPKTNNCSKSEWKRLIKALEDVNVKSISELEAPTNKRLYDGAAIGQLIINVNNQSFRSSSFDDGHPPKEIETLVKEILSIAQNIE